MGIWKEIKYALNSTIGSSEFKSLDKIIKGQKKFIPNNTELISFGAVSISSNNQVIFGYITPKISGELKIIVNGYTGSDYSSAPATFYFGNTVHFDIPSLSQETSVIATVTANQEYRIEVSTSSNMAYIKSIKICGLAVDENEVISFRQG